MDCVRSITDKTFNCFTTFLKEDFDVAIGGLARQQTCEFRFGRGKGAFVLYWPIVWKYDIIWTIMSE